MTAKATLGLLETGGPEAIVAEALDFGTTYRDDGWGSGLTVLVAMANLLPLLDPADRPLALVQALAFVSRDTRGRAPRFPEPALGHEGHDLEQVGSWYRRFVETRSSDAAERSLATLVAAGDLSAAERAMFAAVTDHVFIDEGHTLDFTNKAFEAVALVGESHAPWSTSPRGPQTCGADRSEESGEWNHPTTWPRWSAAPSPSCRPRSPPAPRPRRGRGRSTSARWPGPCWRRTPRSWWPPSSMPPREGATPEQLGRALAYAAALRITRFHLNNDPGDWNSVHHAFTTANALHQSLVRQPTPELLRGVIHGTLRVYLDRFLNVPVGASAAGLVGLARRPGPVLGGPGRGGRGRCGRLRLPPRRWPA